MQVTSNELNAIKTIALSQANLAKLGTFEGKEEMVKHLRQAKKVWWVTIRSRYHLPTSKGSRRLAVELDGDKAGELLYKAKTAEEKSTSAGRVVPREETQEGRFANASDAANKAALKQAAEALQTAQDALANVGAPPPVRSGNGTSPVGYGAHD